ncbi:unnamed protein product, partial [marine sediment metagenome]
SSVTVDMGISTAGVSNWAGDNGGNAYTYTFTVTTGGTVGGSVDPVITWSKVDSAGNPVGGPATITIDSGAGTYTVEGTMTFDIGAGTLVAGNTFTINTNADGDPVPLELDLTSSGAANSISDTYTFTVTAGGTIDTGTPVIAWSNSLSSGTITITASGDYTVDGMTVNFASGTLVVDDTFTITTDTSGSPTANLSSDWHWTLESFKDEFNNQAK